MVGRCTNQNDDSYANYGGRGITICDRWLSFTNFVADMGVKPQGLTLEREDNDGNYEPGNCKWDTDHAQRRNKRTTRLIEFRGETKVLQDWAVETGISQSLLFWRINRWGVERALTTPKRKMTYA